MGRKNSVGGPVSFSGSKLPTNREVVQEWKLWRLTLEAQETRDAHNSKEPRTKIENSEVAEKELSTDFYVVGYPHIREPG